MINYDGKKCQLEIKGKANDIIVEILAIIKSVEIQFDETERRILRNRIVEALYDENMTKMAEKYVVDLKEG